MATTLCTLLDRRTPSFSVRSCTRRWTFMYMYDVVCRQERLQHRRAQGVRSAPRVLRHDLGAGAEVGRS